MNQALNIALKLLSQYKDAIDEVKNQIEVARQLARAIEVFEVTVMMIPCRGNQEQLKKMKAASADGPDEEEDGASPAAENVDEDGDPTTPNVTDQIASEVQGGMSMMINNVIKRSPLSKVEQVFDYFGDGSQIINDVRPAEILQQMRDRGESDLEISFTAMSYLVQSAMKVVQAAVEDVQKLKTPDIYMYVMPWKLMAQKEAGDSIEGHIEVLNKLNVQLQNAISIASYCISLEQLENVLDATSVLTNKSVREFWKKKIGISEVKVKMEMLIETFLNHIRKDILQNKANNFHLNEKLANIRDIPEVALGRFVNQMYNTNNDDWLTVFEMNGNTEKFGRDEDVIRFTWNRIRQYEKLFCSKIEFLPLDLQRMEKQYLSQKQQNAIAPTATTSTTAASTAGVSSYNIQDLLAKNVSKHSGTILHTNDMVVTIQPFQRIVILCKLPRFNKNLYPNDCISLLRYEGITDIRQLNTNTTNEFTFKEIDNCRAYLSSNSNMEFYKRDFYAWNAPEVIQRNSKGDKIEIQIDENISISQNFKETKIGLELSSDSNNSSYNKEKIENSNAYHEKQMFEESGITEMCTMLYTPIMRKPGIYTIRLTLDDLKIDNNDEIQSITFKKKKLISTKNYYYNRSVEERDLFTSIRGSMIMASIEGLGLTNFQSYLSLIIKLYDLDMEEHVLAIEYNTCGGSDCNKSDEEHVDDHSFSTNSYHYDKINNIKKEKNKFINSNQLKVKDYLYRKNNESLANAATTPASKTDSEVPSTTVDASSQPSTPTPGVAEEEDSQANTPINGNMKNLFKQNVSKEMKVVRAILNMKSIKFTGKSTFVVESDGNTENDDDNNNQVVSNDKDTQSKPESSLSTLKLEDIGFGEETKAEIVTETKSIENPPSLEYPETVVEMTSNPLRPIHSSAAEIQKLIKLVKEHVTDPSKFEPSSKHLQPAIAGSVYVKGTPDEVMFELSKGETSATPVPAPPLRTQRKIIGQLPMNLYYQYAERVQEIVDAHQMKTIIEDNNKEALHQISYKTIVLKKILILFEWTKMIIQVEEFIRTSLKSWRDRLPFTSNLLLQQIENSLKEYKGLVGELGSFKDSIFKMIETSPPNLLSIPQEPQPLINFDNDGSNTIAMAALLFEGQSQLFQQFYVVKISLYYLDAKESVQQLDIDRVKMLEQKMKELNNIVVKVYKDHGYKFPVANYLLNHAVSQRKIQLKESLFSEYFDPRFDSRDDAVSNIQVFIDNAQCFLKKLQQKLLIEEHNCAHADMTSNIVSYSPEWFSLRNRISKCELIIGEFQQWLSNAQSSCPPGGLPNKAPLFDLAINSNQMKENLAPPFGRGPLFIGANLSKEGESFPSRFCQIEGKTAINFEEREPRHYLTFVKIQLQVFSCELQEMIQSCNNAEIAVVLRALAKQDAHHHESSSEVVTIIQSIRKLLDEENQFIAQVKQVAEKHSKVVPKDLLVVIEEHNEAKKMFKEMLENSKNAPAIPEENEDTPQVDQPNKASNSLNFMKELPSKSKRSIKQSKQQPSIRNLWKPKSTSKLDQETSTTTVESPSPTKPTIATNEAQTDAEQFIESSLPFTIDELIEKILAADANLFESKNSADSNESKETANVSKSCGQRLFLVLSSLPRYHFKSFIDAVKSNIVELKEKLRTKKVSSTVSSPTNKQQKRLSHFWSSGKKSKSKLHEQVLLLPVSEAKRLEKVTVILKQILVIFELTQLIQTLDVSLETRLLDWHKHLPASNIDWLEEIKTGVQNKDILINKLSYLVQNVYGQLEKMTQYLKPLTVEGTDGVGAPEYLLQLKDDSAVVKGDSLDGNKKVTSVKDIDRIAKDTLIFQDKQPELFMQYYVLKAYLYAVDAHESMEIHDWKRLNELESRTIALNDLVLRAQIKRETLEMEEKQNQQNNEKDKQTNSSIASAPSLTVMDHRNRLKEILKRNEYIKDRIEQTIGKNQLPRSFQDYKRSTVVKFVQAYLQDLEKLYQKLKVIQSDPKAKTHESTKSINTSFGLVNFHDSVSKDNDLLKAVNDSTTLLQKIEIIQRIDHLQEVISHLRGILERAKNSSPPTRELLASILEQNRKIQREQKALTSANDSGKSNNVIKPHGLIINVEKKNAMIWGQAIIHSGADALLANVPSALVGGVGTNVAFETHYIKRVVTTPSALLSASESNVAAVATNNDKQVVHWRPLIDLYYPYNNKRVIEVPQYLIKDAPPTNDGKISSESSDAGGEHNNRHDTANQDSTQIDMRPIFCIFHYTFKHNGTGPVITKSDTIRAVPSTPTHVAFFPLKKDVKKDLAKVTINDLDLSKLIGEPCVLLTTAKYTELDLKTMFQKVEFAMNETEEVRETYFLVFVSALLDAKKVCQEYVVVENSPLLQLDIHESKGFQNEDDAVSIHHNSPKQDDDDQGEGGDKDDEAHVVEKDNLAGDDDDDHGVLDDAVTAGTNV